MLFVADFELMKHFYQHVFGFAILEEIPSEWILFSAGNAKIGLHKIGSNYTDISNNSFIESNTKIIFETDADIHQLHTILLTKGVAVKDITSFTNYPYLLFIGQDPEGNMFQVIRKKEQ